MSTCSFCGLRWRAKDNRLCTTRCALCLLEELAHEVGGVIVESFTFEKLRVAENGGQRIVEFVGHARNKLSDGRHLLALQQLFLSLAQIFVGAAGLLVETDLFYGGG